MNSGCRQLLIAALVLIGCLFLAPIIWVLRQPGTTEDAKRCVEARMELRDAKAARDHDAVEAAARKCRGIPGCDISDLVGPNVGR